MDSLLDNCITSIDFNPNGETVCTIDRYGTCLVTAVNTNNYSFHLNLETSSYWGGIIHSVSYFSGHILFFLS